MLYVFAITDAGVPKTGLTLTWFTNKLKKIVDGTDYDADPNTNVPFTEIAGLGLYTINLTPSDDIIGVVDASVSITNDFERYHTFRATPFDNMSELLMRGVVTGLVVANGANTTVSFKTDLPGANPNQYKGAFLRIDTAPLIGEVKKIIGFNKDTGFVTLEEGLVAIPVGGTKIKVINGL